MHKSPSKGPMLGDEFDGRDLLRTLIDTLPDQFYVKDTEGRYVFSNTRHAKALGAASPEEAAGRTVFDFYPKELAERYHSDEQEIFHSGCSLVDKEEPVVDEEGNERWHSSTKMPLRDDSGKIVGLVGMTRDITERKEAEEALKESEERYRAVVEQSAEAIWLFDPETKEVLESNTAFQEMLGYSKEELQAMTNYDFVAHSRQDIDSAIRRVVQERRGFFGERRYRRKDGSVLYVEVSGSVMPYRGRAVVCAVARDLTERKRAEEALRESEERHRAVVEQSVEGIYLFDPNDGRVLETNGAFEKLLGYTSEELLGITVYDFIAHEREDIERNVRLDHEERRRHKGERKYRRKDGSLVDVEVSAAVIPYREGEAVCCVVHDVTERKKAEKALRKSEARLAEAQRIAHLGSWEWDIETGEVSWSDEVFRIYGYEPKEFVPTLEKLMEMVHPDDRELVRKNIDGALYEDKPYDFEHRIVRPDGEERVVRRQAKVYFEEEGEPLRMVGTVHDITEQKEAEEALKESEERFRSAFVDAPIGVALVDLDGRRFRVNRAFCEMLGYPEEELLSKDYLEDLHPEDQEISANHFRRTLEERAGSYTLERRYVHADGHVVWDLSSVSLIRDSQGNPSHFVCLHQDITERKALEEHLEHQAFHDSMTGLPNRILFLDRLGHALARASREDGSVAVLLVDLDDFKVVNDSLGHDKGNAVLAEVAERLQESVRPGDTVGRIFGDEFAVLLEAPSGIEEARRVAERIQEHLRAHFDVDGQEIYVSTSIGIALSETSEDKPKEILRHADLAMYKAKSRGKDQHEVYSPSMNIRAVERLDLESELRRAVKHEQFEVHYQPMIELKTGKVAGLEALARWRHPERGLVEAKEFIQVAEETGLIRTIGQRVLEEACQQAKEWHERHPGRAPLMSVNLSASQFSRQPDLVPKVLNETGLEPSMLQLEITERVVMDDAEFSIGKLKKLKGLGVNFAIDDYGMGYSCLYYLKRMPLDFLKIDGAFVVELGEGDPEDEAIVAGTIGLAHALGLKVTAEGVEAEEQLAKLKELGCDLAQGYHLAEPLAGEETSALLADNRRR